MLDVPHTTNTTAPLAVPRASDVVRSLFEAVNERNFGEVMTLIANDCQYHGLAFSHISSGKLAVAKLYMDMVNNLPDDVALAIEDITEGDASRAGVTWHIEVEGVEVPGTRGVSFVRLDAEGRVEFIRESPEHPLKLAPLGFPALALASSVVRSMGSTAVALTGMAELVEQAVHNTPLEPLAAMMMGPLLGPTAGTSTDPRASDFHLPNPLSTLTSVAGAIIPQPAPPASSHARPAYAATSTAAPSSYFSPPMQPGGPPASHALSAPTSASPSSYGHYPTGPPHTPEGRYLGPIRGAASSQGLFAAAASSPAASSYHAPDSNPQPQQGHSPAASSKAAAQQALPQPSPSSAGPAVDALVLELSGVWEKDMHESQLDAYEKCLDVWGITGMQKLTARLIEGLEVEDRRQQGGRFSVHHLTIIPQFKATEAFTLGQATRVRRRDMRPGSATGTLVEIPRGVRAVQEWAQPFAGRLEEEYTLRDDGKMSVVSKISVGERSAEVLQVFVRGGLDRKEFLRRSEQRNGSAQEWVTKFIGMRTRG